MQPIIDVSHITMRFQMDPNRTNSLKEWFVSLLSGKRAHVDFYALNDICFQVYPKEVIGIIGHNGSGKSTLLKVISGIFKPTAGSVYVGARIVPMLELGSGFDLELTGRENIYLNGSILGYSKDFLEAKYQFWSLANSMSLSICHLKHIHPVC
jgi:ABC-type polysaccharide/polyol phosphate transport system ATPase subunit